MGSAKKTLQLGIRATALMSASFLFHPHLRPPPQAVAYNAARAVGVSPEDLPRLARHAYWVGAHVGFGTALTAARRLLPFPRSDVAYGLAVWLVNYGAALPAARIYPSPRDDDNLRVAAGVVAHAIFGAALRNRVEPGS